MREVLSAIVSSLRNPFNVGFMAFFAWILYLNTWRRGRKMRPLMPKPLPPEEVWVPRIHFWFAISATALLVLEIAYRHVPSTDAIKEAAVSAVMYLARHWFPLLVLTISAWIDVFFINLLADPRGQSRLDRICYRVFMTAAVVLTALLVISVLGRLR